MTDITTSLNIPHSAPGASAHAAAALSDLLKKSGTMISAADLFSHGHANGVRFGMVNGFVAGWRRHRRVAKKRRNRQAYSAELRVLLHELRQRARTSSFCRSDADMRLVAEIQSEIASLRHMCAMAEHEVNKVFLGGTNEEGDGLHPGATQPVQPTETARSADCPDSAGAGGDRT